MHSPYLRQVIGASCASARVYPVLSATDIVFPSLYIRLSLNYRTMFPM